MYGYYNFAKIVFKSVIVSQGHTLFAKMFCSLLKSRTKNLEQ